MLSAKAAIERYAPPRPFSSHLKALFAKSKKFGSRDRKIISALCYGYFRVAKAFPEHTIERIIETGVFLTGQDYAEVSEYVSADYRKNLNISNSEKLAMLGVEPIHLFPPVSLLSDEIPFIAFSISMLTQPLFFLRVRPGRLHFIEEKLRNAHVPFKFLTESCLHVPQNLNVENILELNKDVVVQDMNSQRVFEFPGLAFQAEKGKHFLDVWDCCAASGGKSLLLIDKLQTNFDLTVSDIRPGILHNLELRLFDGKIPIKEKIIADLTHASPFPAARKFNVIICDVPCTGSGTWSRTPEQLFFFNTTQVAAYRDRQLKIAMTSSRHLQKRGLFFYITCSVFKSENEEVVSQLQQKSGLRLLHMKYLKGFNDRADSMFVAVLTHD